MSNIRIQPSTLLLLSSGGIVIFAFVAAPLLWCRERSLGMRFGLSPGYALAFGVVWALGIFMANIQILCRLF